MAYTISEEELFADANENEDIHNLVDHMFALPLTDQPSIIEDRPEVEDIYDHYYDGEPGERDGGPNQQQSYKVSHYQPFSNRYGKYLARINVEKYDVSSLPNHAVNHLSENQRKNENKRRIKDKSQRATTEQVLDKRTLIILYKWMDNGKFSQIDGCISTGKEANVYHASGSEGKQCAIKIFKTSILVFKNRDKYIEGEFRYRRGYSKKSNRAMVLTWAEKEMRNLKRVYSQGLNVPEPMEVSGNVLVMGFVGDKGWPAPQLKDVNLSQSEARRLYREIVLFMWKLYNKCKLVHADLSEFNILYHKGEIVIIDVSQSMEHNHASAFDFLRTDCTNITSFFKRKGVATMNIRELFDFITDPSITEDKLEECLDKLSDRAAGQEDLNPEQQVDEEVFKKVYVPKRLDEVVHYERDIREAKSGNAVDLVYKTVVGLKADLSGTVLQPEILEENRAADQMDEESLKNNSTDDETSDEAESKFCDSSRPKHETLEEKKARKKAVKEAQAEKRKVKIKKFIKKRKEKKKK